MYAQYQLTGYSTVVDCWAKNMGKDKKEKKDREPKDEEPDAPKKQRLLSLIATPMASPKLLKKCLKTVKKASKAKQVIANKPELCVDGEASSMLVAASSRLALICFRSALQVRRGVKEVVKAIKKGEQGVAIIAGDISPIDVIAHVPILCEEKGIAYTYVDSKEELGLASQTKRPTSILLLTCKGDTDYKDEFEELQNDIKAAMPLW